MAERRANHERLSEGLAGVAGLRPVAETPGGEHVYHRHSPTIVPDETGRSGPRDHRGGVGGGRGAG